MVGLANPMRPGNHFLVRLFSDIKRKIRNSRQMSFETKEEHIMKSEAKKQLKADPTEIPAFFDPQKRTITGYSNHSGSYIEIPFISQITDNLWMGGSDNNLIAPDFIDHIVSVAPWFKYSYLHKVKTHLEFYMYDSTDQDLSGVDEIAEKVNELRKTGTVLVHCQAGLNRSGVVTARALMLEGLTAAEAVGVIRKKRSLECLSNPAFVDWLFSREENAEEETVQRNDS
jgi:protein-tyrosine phosphatase